MTPFFTAAADYARSRNMAIVMRRSDEGAWWAVIILRDAYGRFEANVHYMEPIKARKASKDSPARLAETDDEFYKRVSKEVDLAVVRARRTRVGIPYSSAEAVDAAVAA